MGGGRTLERRRRGPVCPREKSSPRFGPRRTKTQLRLYASLAPRNGVNGVKFRGGALVPSRYYSPSPPLSLSLSSPSPSSEWWPLMEMRMNERTNERTNEWMNDRPKLDSLVFPHAEISLTNPASIWVLVIFFIPPLLSSSFFLFVGIRFSNWAFYIKYVVSRFEGAESSLSRILIKMYLINCGFVYCEIKILYIYCISWFSEDFYLFV